jgi:hypothetical protein
MIKWIRVEQDGVISLVSEIFNASLIEIELTEQEYDDILLGKNLYINGDLVENPNWTMPQISLEEQVEELRRKKEFGQTTILRFMAETQVEGLFMTNPQLAQESILLTQGLVDSLNSGWLMLAISQIKVIPESFLNSVVSSDILLKYRNEIHTYLNIPVVLKYND